MKEYVKDFIICNEAVVMQVCDRLLQPELPVFIMALKQYRKSG